MTTYPNQSIRPIFIPTFRLLFTEMVIKSLTGTLGSRLMEPFFDYTEEQATPENTEPWFPGCPFFDAMNKDPERGCTFIRAQKDRK